MFFFYFTPLFASFIVPDLLRSRKGFGKQQAVLVLYYIKAGVGLYYTVLWRKEESMEALVCQPLKAGGLGPPQALSRSRGQPLLGGPGGEAPQSSDNIVIPVLFFF